MHTRTYEYLHMMTDREGPRRQTKKNGRDMHPRVTPLTKREGENESRTGMVRSQKEARLPAARPSQASEQQ
ncbi:uncharacterized protein LY79DRAFT_544549 [Colletotrichum navitas]|uniref:Uncharacterized protein n=1 Tax=Colletotrichum navitas TaxID=681940 RepID=A0AAD8Q711_9PEZI|nr:uncharacterized protein LY79DRAFT_544549 [Colletotrichum navitas]KAK1596352.1 hypothetical protein LY79DRAFT_544549 [Colletotrichum navitas]